MHSYPSMIATNRFGLGARPGEAAAVAGDPRGWLLTQLDPGAVPPFPADGLRNARQAAAAFYAFQKARRSAQRKSGGDEKEIEAALEGMERPRELVAGEIRARVTFAATTPAPFHERLVRFWSNHFTVSTRRTPVVPLAGPFEREAIRPPVGCDRQH